MTESGHSPAAGRLWGAQALGDGHAGGARGTESLQFPMGPSMVTEPWLLTTRDFDVRDEMEWDLQAHADHELLWSTAGTVTVEAAGQLWVVPPALAIWLPAGLAHRVRAQSGAVTLATYVGVAALEAHTADPEQWRAVAGVPMTGSLRELLMANHWEEMPAEQRARLQRVILDRIRPVRAASVALPMPADPELLWVAREIIRDPAENATVEAWAARLNVSGRTLMRRFSRETGMSLTQWRILARVRRSLIELAEGAPVVAVARSLGYANPGTFIDLFRQVTGQTPAAYFRALGVAEGGVVKKPERVGVKPSSVTSYVG